MVVQSGDLGPRWFHVAIRAVVLMAGTESKLKSNYIAELLGEDPTAVRKILSKLAKAELVMPHGGRYGGYSLKKTPEEITIKDIYHAFENTPPLPYWEVPSTGSELYISMIIAKAEEEFQSVLKGYTIKDILKLKENEQDISG
jgi:Rrf2 family protein